MKKIIKQIVQFVGISGIGWIIDFSIYNLLNLKFINVAQNNMISSIIAVSFVFCVSTRKTFANKENGISLRGKFVVYIVYQIILILLISQVLSFINQHLFLFLDRFALATFSAILAKIIVTPITMILNFVVMKVLIERI